MIFKKFTDIENHYREKYLDILLLQGFINIQWHASEKLDGANFQFITDGKEVKIASRNNIVDTTFYSCAEVVERYSEKVRRLKETYYPGAEQIAVYGELYGPSIQGKVNYGPDKGFAAFELQVDGEVIDTTTTSLLFGHCEIPMSPPIGVFESLHEALAVSNDFKSLLFPDAEGENIAEGIVLKPVIPVFTTNGSRVIIKNKNALFSEKTKRPPKEPKEPNPFIPVVEQYVNENRMNAVISKEGELTHKDFGRLIKLMADDVIKDMIKDDDLPQDWKKQEDCKMAGKAVSSVVANFLKKNLLSKL